MLTLPSTICNLTNYLHTHLGRAFDNNVQKQQGKQISIDLFWIKITHHRLCWWWHHDGLGAIDFTVHLPLSPQLTSGASLIHRRQRAATIWRWDVVFTNMFSLLILSHLVKFDSSVRCATHHTSHTNLNPIHHPGAQITSLRYIYSWWRGAVEKGEIWHATFSFANFWLFYSSALCLSNTTT